MGRRCGPNESADSCICSPDPRNNHVFIELLDWNYRIIEPPRTWREVFLQRGPPACAQVLVVGQERWGRGTTSSLPPKHQPSADDAPSVGKVSSWNRAVNRSHSGRPCLLVPLKRYSGLLGRTASAPFTFTWAVQHQGGGIAMETRSAIQAGRRWDRQVTRAFAVIVVVERWAPARCRGWWRCGGRSKARDASRRHRGREWCCAAGSCRRGSTSYLSGAGDCFESEGVGRAWCLYTCSLYLSPHTQTRHFYVNGRGTGEGLENHKILFLRCFWNTQMRGGNISTVISLISS